MKGKVWLAVVLAAIVALQGCALPGTKKDDKIVKDKTTDQKESVTVIPETSSVDYRMLHPDQPSDLRGYIGYAVQNRSDIDEMEKGLMRLSKSVYDPENYYFQNGRYLTPAEINDMLKRKGKKGGHSSPTGLNPKLGSGKDLGEQMRNSPEYLSYILEQDYMKPTGKDEYKLGGVSLAISLNQVYSDKQVDPHDKKTYSATVKLDKDTVMKKGKAYAQKVVERVRKNENLKDVPIFVTLYLEAPAESYVPGHFYAKTSVKSGSNRIGDWKAVKENYVLFPSDEASKNHKNDSDSFDKFKKDVSDYFPESIGVIAKGQYIGGSLTDLTFNVNIRFFDETEIISFAHYLSSLLSENFPFSKDINVQVYVKSVDKMEAVIVKKKGESTPFVHVINN